MPDNVSGSRHPGDGGKGINHEPGEPERNASRPSGVPSGKRQRKTIIVATSVAAAAVFTAMGFGVTSVIRDRVTSAAAASAIPSPPAHNQRFVEDDEGAGADSQANILQSTVPGLVRVESGSGAGTGVVLTSSGLVLISAAVTSGPGPGGAAAHGAGTITARLLPSGRAFTARIVGSDPAHGLTLLQVESGSAFRPVAVGNSRDVGAGAAVISIAASANGRAFTLGVGSLTGEDAAFTVGGRRLTGLMATTARVMPGGVGGPLVNLSGQVIGLDVAGWARGVDATGYAIPVNSALAVARQLNAARH